MRRIGLALIVVSAIAVCAVSQDLSWSWLLGEWESALGVLDVAGCTISGSNADDLQIVVHAPVAPVEHGPSPLEVFATAVNYEENALGIAQWQNSTYYIETYVIRMLLSQSVPYLVVDRYVVFIDGSDRSNAHSTYVFRRVEEM